MFYLVYVSKATRRFEEAQLLDILAASRRGNSEIGVTGLLLYKDGRFMQMLEGAEKIVRELLDEIVKDPRHYNVVTLQEGMNEGRLFPDRSMEFRRLDGGGIDLEGYADFEAAMLSVEEFGEDPSRCLRLLRLFREHV